MKNVARPGIRKLTYCLQEADVFSQGAHAATEGDEEHEDPNDQQQYSGVHCETRMSRRWGNRRQFKKAKQGELLQERFL